MTEEDAVMTVKEVSVYLRLAESTVYKLAQEGQLPGRKVGGAWRFSRKGIEGWLGERPLVEKYLTPQNMETNK
jgi:excisionase family DNA binding protein